MNQTALNLPTGIFVQLLKFVKQTMKKGKYFPLLCAAFFSVLLFVSSCKPHPHGAPPGQVKKVTGVHPVTGKPSGKAAAPGQQKKKNKNK